MNRSSLFLLISVTFWGFSFSAIKICLTQLTPVEMISARFVLASLTLLLILKLKGVSLKVTAMRGRLTVAAFMIFVHFWIMAVGMQDTTATNTAWILAVAPMSVALLAWVYLKERFSSAGWIGLIVATFGLVVMVYNGDASNLTLVKSKGDLIVLTSCVSWAIYTVLTRELMAKINPMVATFWMVTIAGAVFVPYTMFTSGTEGYAALRTETWLALIFLGIFCLAIAFWLWSEGLKRMAATKVGVVLYIEPLVATFAAWMILGEIITLWILAGGLLISAGVYLSEKFGKVKIAEHDV